MAPLISICMATYNGEKYLKEQLKSLLQQSYADIEIIINDDNSDDNTVAIIEEFIKVDSRIKLYKNPTNIGYIKNFEQVLKYASGDYIALCDQDDIWEYNKLELLIQNINEATLIYADSLLIDAEGNSLGISLSQKLKNNFINSTEALNFLYDNSVSAHAALFKKELLTYLKELPKELYFDQYIAMTAAALNGVKYYDAKLVRYRQHTTNTLAKTEKTKKSLYEKITTKLQKKVANNESMIKKIQEMQQIQTLQTTSKTKLNELLVIHQSFYNTFYSIKALVFFLQNSNVLFVITTKNRLLLAIKKAIGYKLYKAVPLL
jgi:glycosyltransferase involved in cell wall biosynthesis